MSFIDNDEPEGEEMIFDEASPEETSKLLEKAKKIKVIISLIKNYINLINRTFWIELKQH